MSSLFFILIFDPFAVLSAGFWLSFGAIFIILYGMSCRVGCDNFWWRWGRVQYILAIGLLPILIMWFQKIPITGFFANLVAVPWVGLVVVPLVLTGILMVNISSTLGTLCLLLAANAIELLWPFLGWLSSLDLNYWIPSPSFGVLLLSLIGILVLLQPTGLPGRWIGMIWLFPFIFPDQNKPDHGNFWFTLLDVGQGLSAVIQTSRHILIYDTGAEFSNRFNAGSSVVNPFLQNRGIKNIDMLMISHGDNDHIGGMKYLLNVYPDTVIKTSAPEMINYPNVSSCHEGQSWQWGGVTFQILHPVAFSKHLGNNSSCVLIISNGLNKILLSGDIEKKVENTILSKYSENLSATVLIVPHHGSKTSSSRLFIDAVNPEYALIPVGYQNRFRLPNQDIISRYQSRGIKILDTAKNGAIMMKINKLDVTISSYRHQVRRFWHTKF
jgi:competence protein ComEC